MGKSIILTGAMFNSYETNYQRVFNVGKTMPFLPPMTGNGNHTTYRNGHDWGMVCGIVLPTL